MSVRRVVGRSVSLVMIVCLCQSLAKAEEIGRFGQTYPIQEKDMLAAIYEKLAGLEQSGWLANKQKEMQEQALNSINHPAAVNGLSIASKNNTFYFDPTIIVTENITDQDGRLIVPVGTLVNPIEKIPLTKSMLFFDGEDAKQVAWAKSWLEHEPRAVPILVNGSYIELSKQWQRTVYFDQNGSMTAKLNLKVVPSRVYQEGLRLRIDEIAL